MLRSDGNNEKTINIGLPEFHKITKQKQMQTLAVTHDLFMICYVMRP